MGIAESYRGPSGGILPGLQVDLEVAVERLRDLFRKSGVALAYLFGSYAHGDTVPSSDIDIAILLLLNNAPPALQFEVVSQGQLIYARDDEALNTFEMAVIRRFQDTAYLRAIQNEYLKERARQWYSSGRV